MDGGATCKNQWMELKADVQKALLASTWPWYSLGDTPLPHKLSVQIENPAAMGNEYEVIDIIT